MKNENLKRIIWIVLYAGLMLFASGRWNFPLAAWVAAVFALRFFRTAEKPYKAFLLLWLATAIPTIIAWQGATAMSFIHPAAEALFFLVLTPLSLLAFVLDRIYTKRFATEKNGALLTLVFPVAAAALDFFSAAGSPFGTFGAAAYSQVGVTPLMQTLSFAGMWLLPFIVNWASSVLAYAWERNFEWKKTAPAVLSYGSVLVLVFVFGFGRLLLAQPPAHEVTIGGFSLPGEDLREMFMLANEGEDDAFQSSVQALHAAQLAEVRSLAEEGAQIISLQEGAGVGYTEDVAKLKSDASALAQELGIYIVLPTAMLDEAGEEPMANVVYIIDPNGEIVLEHVKYGGNQFEGSLLGSGEMQYVDTPYGRLSAIICWDADFPTVVAQAGDLDVDLLFIPSNDWYEVRDIHADMSTYRAVENGVAIFRQVGAGVSLAADAYGRVLSRVDGFEPTDSEWSGEQMVTMGIGSVETLYPQVQDLVGLVMMLAMVVLWGKAAWRGLKIRRTARKQAVSVSI